MDVEYNISSQGPNKASNLLILATTLPILCLVTIALRFNIRRYQKLPLQADDWILLPALILVVGMGISTILGMPRAF